MTVQLSILKIITVQYVLVNIVEIKAQQREYTKVHYKYTIF